MKSFLSFLSCLFFVTGIAVAHEALQAPIMLASPTAVLTWTDYPNSVTYDGVIIKRKKTGGTYVEVGRVAKNVTTFTDTTIPVGELVCYVAVGYVGTLMAPDSAEVCGGVLPALTNLVLKFQ